MSMTFQFQPRLLRSRSVVKTLAALLAVFITSLMLLGCTADPDTLVEDYLYGDAETAGKAERDLLGLGAEAVPPLIDAFQSEANRLLVGKLLARLGKPAAEALLPLVGEDDYLLATEASELLVELGSDAVLGLTDELASYPAHAPELAAILGRIGEPGWEPLRLLFNDTTNQELRGLLVATFFHYGVQPLEPLWAWVDDGELGEAALSVILRWESPVILARGVDAEAAKRLLTFTPLEPLVGEVIALTEQLPLKTVEELEQSLINSEGSSLEDGLLQMQLSALREDWNAVATHGSVPFTLLVSLYDAERTNPQSAALLKTALLHHGGLYLKLLLDGVAAEPQNVELALLTNEVARTLEQLVTP